MRRSAPPDRDRLLFLALATLAEQVELARAGPPTPSHGVRLALAVLFAFNEDDRTPFDEYWRQFRDDCATAGSPTTAAYCRVSHLQTKLRGVMRAVGIEPTVATEQPLAAAARRVLPPRPGSKEQL